MEGSRSSGRLRQRLPRRRRRPRRRALQQLRFDRSCPPGFHFHLDRCPASQTLGAALLTKTCSLVASASAAAAEGTGMQPASNRPHSNAHCALEEGRDMVPASLLP